MINPKAALIKAECDMLTMPDWVRRAAGSSITLESASDHALTFLREHLEARIAHVDAEVQFRENLARRNPE